MAAGSQANQVGHYVFEATIENNNLTARAYIQSERETIYGRSVAYYSKIPLNKAV